MQQALIKRRFRNPAQPLYWRGSLTCAIYSYFTFAILYPRNYSILEQAILNSVNTMSTKYKFNDMEVFTSLPQPLLIG